MEPDGIFKKYDVRHISGQTAADADYFVLRLDTDPHARKAALAYAQSVRHENPQLAHDLVDKLRKYQVEQ